MGDGGYIFDEDLSPEFLEFEKFFKLSDVTPRQLYVAER